MIENNDKTPVVGHTPKKQRKDGPIRGPDTPMAVENKDPQDLLARIEALEAEKKTLAAKHDIDVKRLQAKIEALAVKHSQEMQAKNEALTAENDRKVAEMQAKNEALTAEKDFKIEEMQKRIEALQQDGGFSTDAVEKLRKEKESLEAQLDLTGELLVHNKAQGLDQETKKTNEERTQKMLAAVGKADRDGTVHVPYDVDTGSFGIPKASIAGAAKKVSGLKVPKNEDWLLLAVHFVLPANDEPTERMRKALMKHIGSLE